MGDGDSIPHAMSCHVLLRNVMCGKRRVNNKSSTVSLRSQLNDQVHEGMNGLTQAKYCRAIASFTMKLTASQLNQRFNIEGKTTFIMDVKD